MHGLVNLEARSGAAWSRLLKNGNRMTIIGSGSNSGEKTSAKRGFSSLLVELRWCPQEAPSAPAQSKALRRNNGGYYRETVGFPAKFVLGGALKCGFVAGRMAASWRMLAARGNRLAAGLASWAASFGWLPASAGRLAETSEGWRQVPEGWRRVWEGWRRSDPRSPSGPVRVPDQIEQG